jgi:hypothetical protein
MRAVRRARGDQRHVWSAPLVGRLDASAMARLGFIINPIAGMGGRVGLKGSDGVVAEAEQRGAERVANPRALAMLQRLQKPIRIV